MSLRLDLRKYRDTIWEQGDTPPSHACNCVGPRDGQPLCPCRMRSVHVVEGRFVEIVDHGPATPSHNVEGEK